MRDTFARELTVLAASDPRIMILSGDIGNHMFDDFKEQFPERFINCGVAEGNMISVAAGLALSGFRPIVYTFAAFDVTRCYEQIRIDLCFQNLPVIIIGLGGGLTYSQLGPTHYICEDLAILRCLPHMNIICPADPIEVVLALQASLEVNNPVYIRINKKNEPCIECISKDFTIGKARVVRTGSDVCLITTGVINSEVLKASKLLELRGISAEVIHFHTIKPLDEEMMHQICHRFTEIVTIEEHSTIGGLGGMLAEWIVDNQISGVQMLRLGTRDEFIIPSYNQQEARTFFGLSAEQMIDKVCGFTRV
ncbi:MAG TPA: transketolase C-terminal domain-containing protein [Methanospirillum sp.]|uniref:transketolase family protein n=1 Tax=Methanospirillum sp. TaxID=45200 RepID=UPI002BDA0819|nr:transketolase C-terminal domain-containing protein [Methanospirillum sp.]HWQ63561.1 transketolase C-terminal domain-containing protein [Methanospirillum sp.]